MAIEIRPAEARDIAAMAQIEKECFSLPWSGEMLAVQLRPGHVFLTAEEDGAVAGYVGMQYVLDEGYVSNVAVAPGRRRRGIADRLIAELLRRAGELELAFVTLEVRESNAPAAALYRKHGFSAAGRRKNYYEKPREDAVIMTWRPAERN